MHVFVHIAFWLFLIGTALFTVVSIFVSRDRDPADGVSIGVVIAIWLFELGVGVLPTFLLGRRLLRYRNASRP